MQYDAMRNKLSIVIFVDRIDILQFHERGSTYHCASIDYAIAAMDLWQRIQAHPNYGLVFQQEGDRGYCMHGEEGEPPKRMHGITASLRAKFYPDADKVYKAMGRAFGKGSETVTAQKGRSLGSRVHRELHVYAQTMNFASNQWQGEQEVVAIAKERLGLFNRVMSVNNNLRKGYKIHPCTAAILLHFLCKERWVPICGELSVGDIRSNPGLFATQIDSVCVSVDDPTRSKLILCEVKTGYNDNGFKRKLGMLRNLPRSRRPGQRQWEETEVVSSTLIHAKMQIVFGAALLVIQYGIPWERLDLRVVHCESVAHTKMYRNRQTGAVVKKNMLKVETEKVTEGEIRIFLAALHRQGFL